MHLQTLRLRAIGPFAGTVFVDIAAVAQSGVFLLEGPTGSGKSTLIDAIVFALYGSLAGEGASKDRLHSHHAPPTVEPFVELVFQTGAGIFRVRRTPQYLRPKLRGGGTVQQQASAQLWRLASPDDEVGEAVSGRAQEVGAEVTRIIGLDRAQFVQTVVLPQGEFARFLRAPGEDRRALLQSLFGTAIYEQTVSELVDRRRAANAAAEQADRAVALSLGRFAQAAGRESVAEGSVAHAVAVVESAALAAEHARDAARRRAEGARVAVDTATRRHAARVRRTDVVRREQALAARAEETAVSRTQLALGERASRVAAVLEGLARAEDRVEARRSVFDAAVMACVRVVPDAVGGLVHAEGRTHADVGTGTVADTAVAGWDAVASQLATRAEALRATVGPVRHLVAVERGLGRRSNEIAEVTATLQVNAVRLAELRVTLDGRPAERARRERERDVLQVTASDIVAATRAFDAARAFADAVGAKIPADRRLGIAEERHRDAVAVARAALDDEHRLRERRFAGLAGELASTLTDGEPCPVCGAPDHPAPAAVDEGHPDPATVEAAAVCRADADRDLAQALTELELARAESTRIAVLIGSADADVDSVAQALAAAQQRVDAAEEAREAYERAEAALRTFDADTGGLERERGRVAADHAAAAATRDAAVAAIERDRREVEGARDTLRATALPGVAAAATLADAIVVFDAAVAAIDAVTGSARDVETAVADRVARADEVLVALNANGFADAAVARAAILSDARLGALRSDIAAAEEERAIVDAILAEPDVVAAGEDSDERIDLAGVTESLADVQADFEASAHAAATARSVAIAAADTREAVVAACIRRDQISAESRAVIRMADIATAAPGANPTGITLGTYVLMRRFEDVVAAANDRLVTMLGGRYTLAATDERETSSKARRTGLALAVHDHATDTRRDPKSLSGGETFTFSLCLALGLADVVQAEAGGVSLGTLFVDEGFGTLDPETLDGVLSQLSRLTDGGRQVAIVSHVEELKRRISDRIAVRPVPSGGSEVITVV